MTDRRVTCNRYLCSKPKSAQNLVRKKLLLNITVPTNLCYWRLSACLFDFFPHGSRVNTAFYSPPALTKIQSVMHNQKSARHKSTNSYFSFTRTVLTHTYKRCINVEPCCWKVNTNLHNKIYTMCEQNAWNHNSRSAFFAFVSTVATKMNYR